jgi:MazG family protein
MQDDSPLGRAMALVRDLRARCPWDAKQTPESLRTYLVEETHELDQAIADGDVAAKRDELGDVLLNVAFQLVIAEERGEFTATDVADRLIRKMERRHPHLFDLGPAEPWEQLKQREKAAEGRPTSALADIPRSLPGLRKAHRLQARAATVGFDWPDTDGPLAKVREEADEVAQALADGEPHAALEAEIGDLLFAVVNLARKAGVDAAAAMDLANAKFERRFKRMETLATARGLAVATAGLEALDAVWDEVKREERGAEPAT